MNAYVLFIFIVKSECLRSSAETESGNKLFYA
jgi:hypothetical protein